VSMLGQGINWGTPGRMKVVCEQSEWGQMEQARPGCHKLVLSGITNEGEAERLRGARRATLSKRQPRAEVHSPLAWGLMGNDEEL